ncbi:MAG: YggT family protein [Candidatus Dormibacter sp.]|uniref:YggT family protein n=1 Tax=Candidatus Dormibacter sp. TaxID=2973982 RepID=UPI003D9B0081
MPVVPVRAGYNFRAVAVVWFLAGVIDVLIGLRFLLKLLAASTQSAFVDFIYGITAPLVGAFRGIFGDSSQGSYVFEPSSLVAIVVYALIAWGIVALIRIVTAPRGSRPLAR